MRKILYLVLLIELFSLHVSGEITDTLCLSEKGTYILSFGNIYNVNIEPDSIINDIGIDSVRGLIHNRTDFKDTIFLIVRYDSKDMQFTIRKHLPYKYSNYIDSSRSNFEKTKKEYASKNGYVNGLNILNFNMNDNNDFTISSVSNNHFDYRFNGGLTVNGYINDNNGIFSGEGAFLSDISGINVKIAKEDKSILLGDIKYKLNELNQKMIGLDVKSGNKLRIIAGLDGGERGNTEISLENNNLGPYEIIPNNDTLYYIAPNSEIVVLNDKKLTNGIDYTIDYHYGTITFLPLLNINRGDRAYISYQLKSRYNIRHYFHVNTKLNNFLTVAYDETRDWKRNIFNLSYDSATVTDSFIILKGSKYVGNNLGEYISENNRFVYVGNNRGDYRCYFTYMGDNMGSYVFDNTIHGYLFVGQGNGDYLPIIKIRTPKLKRMITFEGSNSGIKGYLNILQQQNNILVNHSDFSYFTGLMYNKTYSSNTDTIKFSPIFNWFSNIKNSGFSNRISEIQSDYNIDSTQQLRNVFLPGLVMEYNYKDILYIRSANAELLSEKKIFKSDNHIKLNLNRYIFTEYSGKYISPSDFNRRESRNNVAVGVKKEDLVIKYFINNIDSDSINMVERGIGVEKSILSLSAYNQSYTHYSSLNCDFSLNGKNLLFRLSLKKDSTNLTDQFVLHYSKRYRFFFVSASGEGGIYKPYFTVPQFIESTNGNYDYDSLNNVYYPVENGHFKKELLYKQYDSPLQTYNINIAVRTNRYFIFNNSSSFKKYFTEINDSIYQDRRFSITNLIQKHFNKNDITLKSDFSSSLFVHSAKSYMELLLRYKKQEFYKIHLALNTHNDETPYLESNRIDYGGFLEYGKFPFSIKFIDQYISYYLPEKQNIINMGTGLTFGMDILNSHFTFTPIFSYNFYKYNTRFAEIDEIYPRGIDLLLKINGEYNMGENTKLTVNTELRYNHIRKFLKTFNLSVGLSL